MNKGRRNELTRLKFKKRLEQLGLKQEDGNLFCYKTSGKPCSCEMCSPYKYKRTEKHKGNFEENFEENEE